MLRKDILSLSERVKDAAKMLEELKKPQPLRGDSWVVHRAISDDTWDLQLNNVASNFKQRYKMTVNVEDPSNGFMNMTYATDITGGIFWDAFPDYDDPYSHYFQIYSGFGWNATNHLYLKFYAFSPQRGTISIQTD